MTVIDVMSSRCSLFCGSLVTVVFFMGFLRSVLFVDPRCDVYFQPHRGDVTPFRTSLR
ncbi:hypothetical protein [Streptomyces sp. NPDC001401]|uniref:hypothetical protein n=1 Tax=Streptomyces sp. NPDC001401 TaxID=3364570 RepID=UPI0036BDF26E